MLKNEELQGWWELAKKSDTPFWPRAVRDLILSLIEALAELDRAKHDHDQSVNAYHPIKQCKECDRTPQQWFEAKRKEILGE